MRIAEATRIVATPPVVACTVTVAGQRALHTTVAPRWPPDQRIALERPSRPGSRPSP